MEYDFNYIKSLEVMNLQKFIKARAAYNKEERNRLRRIIALRNASKKGFNKHYNIFQALVKEFEASQEKRLMDRSDADDTGDAANRRIPAIKRITIREILNPLGHKISPDQEHEYLFFGDEHLVMSKQTKQTWKTEFAANNRCGHPPSSSAAPSRRSARIRQQQDRVAKKSAAKSPSPSLRKKA